MIDDAFAKLAEQLISALYKDIKEHDSKYPNVVSMRRALFGEFPAIKKFCASSLPTNV
ncbi:MAG: hypothetical protein LBV04_04470 [Deferribacteraceae bacterium]|jgi:hypothetical protein|nr:hypothetical protein [Deferribacteraceae bacterium]